MLKLWRRLMRLAKERVEVIAALIFENLKRKQLIVFKTEEKVVMKRILEIFLSDLQAEDKLDREVEKLLETHSRELEGGDVNYRKMFNMVKSKLAKEKDIIL
jgi:hypothetical protein